MTVTVYTTATCPYCKMLKDYLEKKGVSYTEKLVDQDDAAREEMAKKSGGYLGVPFSIVHLDSGGEKQIVGFDEKLFGEALLGK